MTPETQVFKVQTSQIMTLSLNNDTTIGSDNIEEFEICTKEDKGWGAGW